MEFVKQQKGEMDTAVFVPLNGRGSIAKVSYTNFHYLFSMYIRSFVAVLCRFCTVNLSIFYFILQQKESMSSPLTICLSAFVLIIIDGDIHLGLYCFCAQSFLLSSAASIAVPYLRN